MVVGQNRWNEAGSSLLWNHLIRCLVWSKVYGSLIKVGRNASAYG